MPISIFDASVPVLVRGLTVLSGLLDKGALHAAEHGLDPASLVEARLAPDMLTLPGQVQRASDTAKFTVARLTGEMAPSFDDNEATFDELKERCAKTVAFLKALAALGGGIAVQHRMAYQGEYFVERYGHGAAEATPPVATMLAKGVKVSAGTDATRVASYNPWVSLSWLVTGRTVGGLQLYPRRNCLDGRRRCACGPRTSPGSRTRKARRAASRSASSPT